MHNIICVCKRLSVLSIIIVPSVSSSNEMKLNETMAQSFLYYLCATQNNDFNDKVITV